LTGPPTGNRRHVSLHTANVQFPRAHRKNGFPAPAQSTPAPYEVGISTE